MKKENYNGLFIICYKKMCLGIMLKNRDGWHYTSLPDNENKISGFFPDYDLMSNCINEKVDINDDKFMFLRDIFLKIMGRQGDSIYFIDGNKINSDDMCDTLHEYSKLKQPKDGFYLLGLKNNIFEKRQGDENAPV